MQSKQNKRPQNIQEIVAGERRRIGEELHSRAAQWLSHALFLLNLHEKHHKTEDLDGARQAIKLAIGEIRHTIGELREEEPWPLVPSLRDCVNSLRDRLRIPVAFSASGYHVNIPPGARHYVITLVEEGLNNVSKHAHASKCAVKLNIKPKSISISIEDDGVGYHPKIDSRGAPHFGLKFMKEQAAEMGGRLRIYPVNGKGTRLSATIPLGNQK